MSSERSSLLSLQRRQQKEIEKKQHELQIERQRQQQYSQRYHHQQRPPAQVYPRGSSNKKNQLFDEHVQNHSVDFLTGDGDSSNRDVLDRNNTDSRNNAYYGGEKNLDTTMDLIQLDYNTATTVASHSPNNYNIINDDDDNNAGQSRMHLNLTTNTKRHVKELQLRARSRKKKNNIRRDDDDEFESIIGVTNHIHLQNDEQEEIEILNSFDEDDDEEESSNNDHGNDLLNLGMVNDQSSNTNAENSSLEMNSIMNKNHQQSPNLMDGTFYAPDNIEVHQTQQGHRKILHQHSNQQDEAKKAISTLFGMSYKNDHGNEFNNSNTANVYNQTSSMKSIYPFATNDNFALLGQNHDTLDRRRHFPDLLTNNNKQNQNDDKPMRSSSLLDQANDEKMHMIPINKIISSPSQTSTLNKSIDQNHVMNTNANRQSNMKMKRSPLQITSSSLDPELFMPSQQQHYVPNLSDISSSKYMNHETYAGNNVQSKMSFRHTTFTSSADGTINNLSKSSNNVDTARSWFGGNLNTNTGSFIPSSSISIATSSTISSTEDRKKNRHMHILGSSSYNQTLPVQFEQEESGMGISTTPPSYVTHTKRNDTNHWNWLNVALFLSYGFTTAANLVPITLIPTIAMDILQQSEETNEGDNNDDQSLSILASRFASVVATHAALGTALGKFLNGSLGDIFGARRVACYFSLLHSFTLFILSFCSTEWSVICCCVTVEYYQSVQWPCIAVILATHYGNGILGESDGDGVQSSNQSPVEGRRGDTHGGDLESSISNSDGKYEKGIYIASLGSRGGALFASVATTLFLRYEGMGWRGVARLASFGSFLGFTIMYLFVTDSPKKLHDPQNPIKEDIPDVKQLSNFTFYRFRNSLITMEDITKGCQAIFKLTSIVFFRNVIPSLRSVLSNVTFWVVAIAHSGGLMVCSSIRILGTYFRDTSGGVISENQAGFVSLFLSVGILVGLFFGGNIFGDLSNNPKARKSMVSKLYIMTVTMCYSLSFLAIPMVRNFIKSPKSIAFFQAIATFVMGAGVAVQVYCIPAIVGCTFGANKGLYASYTDGVAYTISSLVWRIMGNAVEEGNPEGAGWAYGWAAVALLVVLAGFLMVEFVEHYFCRGGWVGRLRDAEAKAKYYKDNESDKSFGEKSSVSRLAENGKKIWGRSHSLFRPVTLGKSRAPEMNSILSVDEDDDDVSTILFENAGDVEDLTPPDKIASQIQRLLSCEGNMICIDCGSPFPRWAAIIVQSSIPEGVGGRTTLGAFCCSQCAGSHRKLGTHIVFVRSIDHDNFNSDEVRALEVGGNTAVNRLYEAKLSPGDSLKIHSGSTLIERERFIAAKYERKLWYQYNNHSHSASSSAEIELVYGLSSQLNEHKYDKKESPSSVIECTTDSVFEQAAPVDQDTIDHYESFVKDAFDSQSEYFSQQDLKDDGSMSSEDSSAWQIHGNERGLDVYIDL